MEQQKAYMKGIFGSGVRSRVGGTGEGKPAKGTTWADTDVWELKMCEEDHEPW